MPELLPADTVTSALALLGGWTGDHTAIRREVTASSFAGAIKLVDQVAEVAEEMNHHPNMDIRWRTVTFTLSTHSMGGVTDLDITLARRIDALAAQA